MSEASLKTTLPEATVIGADTLVGYKRVFNIKSLQRYNSETDIYASAVNVVPEADYELMGLVFKTPPDEKRWLFDRERGYELRSTTLQSGQAAHFFIATEHEPHSFALQEPLQDDYLRLCLEGARSLGEAVYENFLDTTFIDAETTVRQYLQEVPQGLIV